MRHILTTPIRHLIAADFGVRYEYKELVDKKWAIDLETGEQVEVDTSQAGIREAYATHAHRRHAAIERAFTRAGALAWEVTTAEPVVGSIVRLLETRRRMATGLRRAQVAG